MGLVLEAQILENVVNQMEEVLANHWNFPDNSSLGRVTVTKRQEVKQFTDMQTNSYLQVDLGIE